MMGEDEKGAILDSCGPDGAVSGAAGGDVAVNRGNAGKGRIEGAKNLRDPKLKDYCLSRYGVTPAQRLADLAFMSTIDYARAANLVSVKTNKLDLGAAARRQEGLLTRLLPYTEKKMPTELEVTDTKRVVLQIGRIAAPDGPQTHSTGQTIDLVPANISKTIKNQRVRDLSPPKSDSQKSDGER